MAHVERGVGFRPTGPNGRWTRGDRLRNAARAAAVAISSGVLSAGSAALARHDGAWQAAQPFLESSGALLAIPAFLAAVVALLELLRAPFGR